MSYFAIALFFSFVTTLWLVRNHRLHAHVSHDHDLDSPQKFHEKPVARVGGVGIMVGLLAFFVLALIRNHPSADDVGWFLLASSFAFFAGLAEDLTKRVSPMMRLMATALAAILAGWWIHATIDRLDIWGLDYLVKITIIGLFFTAFAVAGIANAINIIDGFNGLASAVVCTMLLSLLYVAFTVNDAFVMSCSLALLGALIGFFVWNYPSGSIFLGDGGAYLIGFLVADLSVILVNRHLSVSPWYPVLLFIYPLVETLFSAYRKKMIRKMSPTLPDGVHLHMLIYRRLIRWTLGYQHLSTEQRNAMTSPYLWLLSSMAVLPATLFFQHTWVLLGFVVMFVVSYIWIYRSLVRFKSPFWMAWLHRHRKEQPNQSIK